MVFICAAGAVEGIDPPRKPLKVDVALDEDIPALPGRFLWVFEGAYRRFLFSRAGTTLAWAFGSGGVNGVSGAVGASSERASTLLHAEVDTVASFHYRAEGCGLWHAEVFGAAPVDLQVEGVYDKRLWRSRYPKVLGGRLRCRAMYPWRGGLVSARLSAGGAVYDADSPAEDKRRELWGSAVVRGFRFVEGRFGAFGEAGYVFVRRGEKLFPESFWGGVLGGFYKLSPLVVRAGAEALRRKDEGNLYIRPSLSLRWLGYPFVVEVEYGLGGRVYPVVDVLPDPAVDPEALATSVVETVGVAAMWRSSRLKLSGAAVAGKAAWCPFVVNVGDTAIRIEGDEAVVMRGWLRAYFATKLAGSMPFENAFSLAVDASRTENGHPLPMVSKYTVVDSASLKLADWLSVWGKAFYRSGFFTDLSWRSGLDGFYFFSAGVEFHTRGLSVGIMCRNITGRWILDEPLFYHGKRDLRITVGIRERLGG